VLSKSTVTVSETEKNRSLTGTRSRFQEARTRMLNQIALININAIWPDYQSSSSSRSRVQVRLPVQMVIFLGRSVYVYIYLYFTRR